MRQALGIAMLVWVVAACSMIGGREAAAAGFIADGRRSLGTVPEWEPGAEFVDRLRHVSDVIDASDAGPSLDLVDDEYRDLYDKNGFTCEWIFLAVAIPVVAVPRQHAAL